MNYKEGDIIDGEKTFHKIVFLGMDSDETFEGCMLTHAGPEKGYDNIELKKEHFEVENEKGQRYSFQFDDTYFVKARLVKKVLWGPFEKVGRLTDEGIKYLNDSLKGQQAINWKHYIGKEED